MNHRCRIHQFNISKIFALCLQGFSAIRFRVLVGSRCRAGEKPFGKNDDLPGSRPGRSGTWKVENYPFCRFFETPSRGAVQAVWEKQRPSRSTTFQVGDLEG